MLGMHRYITATINEGIYLYYSVVELESRKILEIMAV